MSAALRIGMVAGEVSGDVLGSGLMRALKARLGEVRFEGIGGPRMQAEGCKSLYDMERLTVIGFEGAGKYLSILGIRRRLARHFVAHPPDLFIGIDVPDFNLTLEQRLRAAGIMTMHYVSPTVWAWRGYRIRKIHEAVDHMLTLFPFEARYYEAHGIPVTYVGHPLADEIPEDCDPGSSRATLGLPREGELVALLPGSRRSELRRHAVLFVRAAQWLHARRPGIRFVAPFASAATEQQFIHALRKHGAESLPIARVLHRSREALAACDVALLASGTATLEAALLRKPMVVTYKVSALSAALVRLFVHVKLYSLPNNLAGRELVPELMQSEAVPQRLGAAVEGFLANPERSATVRAALGEMHAALKQNADERAAGAVIRVLSERVPRARPPATRGEHDANASAMNGEPQMNADERR